MQIRLGPRWEESQFDVSANSIYALRTPREPHTPQETEGMLAPLLAMPLSRPLFSPQSIDLVAGAQGGSMQMCFIFEAKAICQGPPKSRHRAIIKGWGRLWINKANLGFIKPGQDANPFGSCACNSCSCCSFASDLQIEMGYETSRMFGFRCLLGMTIKSISEQRTSSCIFVFPYESSYVDFPNLGFQPN